MGSVYRARLRADGGLEKIVAVKVLDESVGDDADLARRLRDEARILGRLQHRAIVRVEGLMRLAGRWTIAMEYVDGVDLAQVLAKRGKLPGAAALEIVREAASALHHAHSATDGDGVPLRIIHRDLKPANLRITPSGDVKVLDFGVARARFEGREAETRAGGYGSVGYVPPERVDGDELPAGDVFALGVVTWEMLAGGRFGAGHLLSKKHTTAVEERLAAIPKVPEPVRELLAQMLAFDPDRRPTARDVERKVTELLDTVKGSRRLADWCEEHVPPLVKEVNQELLPGSLVGRTFTEESAGPMEPAPPAPAPARAPPVAARPSPVVGCLRGVVWFVVVLVVLVLTPVLLAGVLALGMYVGMVM
jgi:serine/threonine protein kinase